MQEVMGQLPRNQKRKYHVVYTDTAEYENYIRYSIQFEEAPDEIILPIYTY
ncbi:MAG: hypothetical protein WC126_09115 [Proteiniphilum sp.]